MEVDGSDDVPFHQRGDVFRLFHQGNPSCPLKSGTGVLQTRRDNQYVFLLTQSLVN